LLDRKIDSIRQACGNLAGLQAGRAHFLDVVELEARQPEQASEHAQDLPPGARFAERVNVSAAKQNGALTVEVEDDGPGIPEEIRQKIFEPFFTTKPVGKGTGLGLSVSLGIVKNHGGRLEVESEPGKGTTMVVLLPLAWKPFEGSWEGGPP